MKEDYEKIRDALTDSDIKAYKEKYPKVFEALKDEDMPDKTIVMGIISYKGRTKEELIALTLSLLTKIARMEVMASMVAETLGAAINGDPAGDGGTKKYEA